MSILDAHQFIKEIKNLKLFAPVYLFVGDEEALVTEAFADFKSAFLRRYGNNNSTFNIETLQGDRDDSKSILDSCWTLPFGSEKKLVIVHDLGKLSDRAQSELTEYCLSPNPSTALALLWNAKPNPLTLSKELPSGVAQKGVLVKCWKLFEERRVQWIKEKINRLGKKISLEAAATLSLVGGESLNELSSEIEKLFLFVSEKSEIELTDVRETLSFRRDRSVWDFIENLEKGKTKKAGCILEQCLEQGEEPLKLLNLIARSCRKSFRQDFVFEELMKADLLLKSESGKESAVLERIVHRIGSLETAQQNYAATEPS